MNSKDAEKLIEKMRAAVRLEARLPTAGVDEAVAIQQELDAAWIDVMNELDGTYPAMRKCGFDA